MISPSTNPHKLSAKIQNYIKRNCPKKVNIIAANSTRTHNWKTEDR